MISELNNRICDVSFITPELFMPEPDMVLQYMGMLVDDGPRTLAIVEGIKESIDCLKRQEILPSIACVGISLEHRSLESIVFSGDEVYCDSQGFFQGASGAVLIVVTLGDIVERLWASQEFDPFAALANDAVIGAATEVMLGHVIKGICQICTELDMSVGYFLSPGCALLPLDLQSMIVKQIPGNRVAVQDNVIKPAASLSGILPVGGLEMRKGNGKISCNICSCAEVCIDKRVEFW